MSDRVPVSAFRYWAALVPAMTVPFIASLLYFVVLSERPVGRWIYIGAKVFTVLWPILCFVLLWNARRFGFPWVKQRWRSARTHLQALPLGITVGLLIIAALVGLLQTPLGDLVNASAPAILHKAKALGFLQNYLLFATFLSLLHSLVEEYFWRWFVFGQLRNRMSFPAAATVGSIAFAAHHLVVTAQFFPLGFAIFLTFCVGIGGLLWCWLYQRQGTLAGAWISHLIADAGLMTVGYFLLHP